MIDHAMIDLVRDLASWCFLLTGSVAVLVGTLGLVRLPDFYTRLHAAGITDTMGVELMLIGMMLQAGLSLVTVKLFLIATFIFFTSPTATHALANAAHAVGLKCHGVPEDPTASDNSPSTSGSDKAEAAR